MKRIGILILSMFLIISLTSCSELYNRINGTSDSSESSSKISVSESSSIESTESSSIKSTESSSIETTSSSEIISIDDVDDISIHFIDTGYDYNGDVTYIKAGDTDILIDAGPRYSAAGEIEEYVDQYCTDGKLEYVVATHAHQDHIAGFVGTSTIPGLFDYYEIDNLVQFDYANTTSKTYANYSAGVDTLEANGTNVYTGSDFYKSIDPVNPEIVLAKGITMTILNNYYYTHKSSNENNYSVCTLFTAGDKNILLTGDLEDDGEEYLVDLNNLPLIDLFKAGHHGSYTANSDYLLDVIQPDYVVLECACGTDEYTKVAANMFPAQETISRIGKWTNKIYAVRGVDPYDDDETVPFNGSVTFSYNGKSEMSINCTYSDTILPETTWFKENRVMPEQPR